MRSERHQYAASGDLPGGPFELIDDELLGLTRQLSAEADQLASVYPPKPESLDSVRPHTPTRQRHGGTGSRITWWLSACAALALIAVGTYFLNRFPDPGEPTAQSSPGPAADSPAPSPRLVNSQEIIPETAPQSMRATPVMFVSELSDPELEAWLDLRSGGVEERVAF